MNIASIIAELKAEHARLGKAIQVLSGIHGNRMPGKRTLSAAAKARIAAAQKLRWRKWKAEKSA
jgi:hypothetical protein